MSQLAALATARTPPRRLAPVVPDDFRAGWRPDLCLEPDDVAALERLLSSRPELGVFLSSAWMSGYGNDRPSGIEYGIFTLHEGRTLRAVAPLGIRHTATHVSVGFIGGGLGSDRVDLLAARGFEARAADALLDWLHTTFGPRGFVLELRDVCSTSPIWGAIHRHSSDRSRQLTLHPREISTLPYLSLHTSPSPSRSLEKHWRWLGLRGVVGIEWLADPEAVSEAFDCLVGFLSSRWRRAGEASALDDERAVRFHRHVIPRLLEAGRLRMMRLTVAGRTVAVFYGFAVATWWGYYLAGYDREWAGRIHLGQLTLDAAMAAARREGATEFDFLKGAERIKYAWPVRERTTLDADVFSNSRGAQLTRAMRAARDGTAAVSKALFR